MHRYHIGDMGLLKELLKPLAEDGAALTREQAAAVLGEILAGNRAGNRNGGVDFRAGDARRTGAGTSRLCGNHAGAGHTGSPDRRGARCAGGYLRHR